MSESNHAILQRAYELIENDELEQAQEILAPLLETDAENASLWWVYTHAQRDSTMGQAALSRVLELDPAFPGAGELKADVLQLESAEDDFVALEQRDNGNGLSAAPLDIDDWEDLQPAANAETDSSAFRRGFVILVVALVIVVAGAGLVASGAIELPAWLSGLFPTPEPAVIVVSAPTDESTPSAVEPEETAMPALDESDAGPTVMASPEADEAVPTAAATDETVEEGSEEPTAEPTAEPTIGAGPSPTPDADRSVVLAFISQVAEGVSDFAIDPAASGMHTSGLGNTLVIQVCAVPGPEFNERLNIVLNAVVGEADDIPQTVEAVGVGLLNCDDDDASLRIIGVQVSQILEFANEVIDAKDFQRAWQPLS